MTQTTLSTKETIRQTAEKLFREKGFAGIGMRELAREVGIEAPSIYNHYKSKDDVLREICFDTASAFFKGFDEATAKEDKPIRKLKAAILAHIHVIAQNPEAAEVFFNEWIFLQEPNLGKFKKMRHEYEMRYREILDRGIKKGDFKALNPKLVTFTIFSALNATYELYKMSERPTADEIAEEISTMLLKGLKG